ncbi:MAG: hypothetical protein QXJ75_03710 [Candidatus Bathyarchaeia archaeon]
MSEVIAAAESISAPWPFAQIFPAELAVKRPLPSYFGPILIFGLSGVFTVLVWFMGRFKGRTAEEMFSGGRDVGHGMSNAAIVATWVWAATLMMSSWTGYTYGPSGPWWYSLGATLPLPIFAYLGQTLKVKMPLIHTYPEFILFRLDRKNHVCQAIIAMIVCQWVTIMIVSGGSIMYMTYTGLPFELCALCMCISFAAYILVAGAWAAIFADMAMGLTIYVCLGICIWGSMVLLGPLKIWEGLVHHYTTHPIIEPWGPYSNEFYRTNQWDCINYLNAAGIGFLIVNSVGNLGAVLNNSTYWSIAIAADKPRTVWTSYIASALCWAPIPLSMATSRGVVGLALGVTLGETYQGGQHGVPFGGAENAYIYFQEAEAVAPLTAFTVLGYVGLIAFFVAVGAATVSTGAHETMSTVTNFVNDLYRYYIRPKASARELLVLTRLMVGVSLAISFFIVVMWRWLGFTFAGMYQAMGIFFSSAVIPLCCAAFWKDANRDGCFWGTVIGAALGIAYWVACDWSLDWPVVWANIIVTAVSCFICVGWSAIKPENFDFTKMATIDVYIHEEV